MIGFTEKIVVTGMGAVTPLANNLPDTWEKIVAGQSGISAVNLPTEVSVAGQVRDFHPEQTFNTKFEIGTKSMTYSAFKRRLSRATEFSLVASHEALSSAGLLENNYSLKPNIDPDRFGVVIGTGIGGGEIIGKVRRALDKGESADAFDILGILPERVGSVVSIIFGLRGATFTVSSACATGNTAIARGIEELLLNRADLMLVGGTEGAVNELATSFFTNPQMRTLSKETDPTRASRPFDQDRDGFVIAEGAAVLVLETETHALKRGATPIAELVGWGEKSDAYHETEPSGTGALKAMSLARSGLDGLIRDKEIYVKAHATSTKKGDPIEASAIKDAFPDASVVYVNALKSQFGHTLGAAGAIEAVIAVLTLQTGIIPLILHLDNPISETDGLHLVRETEKRDIRIAILNGFGFGGLNSAIAIAKYDFRPNPQMRFGAM